MSDTIASTPLIVRSASAEPPRLEIPRVGVRYALIGYVLSLACVFIVHFISRFWDLQDLEAVQLLEKSTVIASGVAFVATILLWVRWQLRAANNARAMTRESLRFSPAWSVGCFFVPVVHLVAPLFAVTEIWNASHGLRLTRRPPALLAAWWCGCLLPAGYFGLSLVVEGGPVSTAIGVASVVAYPASALLAAMIVGRINARQEAAMTRR